MKSWGYKAFRGDNFYFRRLPFTVRDILGMIRQCAGTVYNWRRFLKPLSISAVKKKIIHLDSVSTSFMPLFWLVSYYLVLDYLHVIIIKTQRISKEEGIYIYLKYIVWLLYICILFVWFALVFTLVFPGLLQWKVGILQCIWRKERKKNKKEGRREEGKRKVIF